MEKYMNISIVKLLLLVYLLDIQLISAQPPFWRSRAFSNLCLRESSNCQSVIVSDCTNDSLFYAVYSWIFSNGCNRCLKAQDMTGGSITLTSCPVTGSPVHTFSVMSDESIRLTGNSSLCLEVDPSGIGAQMTICQNPLRQTQKWFSLFTCPPGSQSNANNNGCVQCPANTVKNITGNLTDKCTPCPPGFSPNEDLTECISCPSGRCSWTYNTVLYAGNKVSATVDGFRTNASIASVPGVRGIIADKRGNFFFTEAKAHTIRKLDTDGYITTFAGGTGIADYIDGMGTNARFNNPYQITYDRNLDCLYVSDYSNNRIRKIKMDGNVTTLAGGSGGTVRDGSFSWTRFSGPIGISINEIGDLIVGEWIANRVRYLNVQTETVTTISGSKTAYLDLSGTDASFFGVNQAFPDNKGSIYVADLMSNALRRIFNLDTHRNVTTFSSSLFGYRLPDYVYINPITGFMYFTDRQNGRLYQMTSYGVPKLVISGIICGPWSMAADSTGDMLVGGICEPSIHKTYACPPYSFWNASSTSCVCMEGYEKQMPNACVQCSGGMFKNATGNQNWVLELRSCSKAFKWN